MVNYDAILVIPNGTFFSVGFRLMGVIYDDKAGRFPDGTAVITSTLAQYMDGVVTTASGTRYKLENPTDGKPL